MPGRHKKQAHVAVVGGGLVGSLNACFFAKRGFKVDLYEQRPDIRTQEAVRGRSINLALSCRGREALKAVGVEEIVINNGIPMYGRLIHDLDGTQRSIPYGKQDQYIMSVDRRLLNEVLLTASEQFPSIKHHFEHKLVNCDFDTGTITLERPNAEPLTPTVDLIVGTDGAYSVVRRELMKRIRLDYQQIYIPHGYMEFCMPPAANNKYAMEINALHIWPRNEYMMIALPNLDKTYTVTLFMPFTMYDHIKDEYQLLAFFREKFPDAVPLLTESVIKETYRKNKPQALVCVKCSPYHVADKAVLMGDAAHAMVPFYGQGMNTGFEDCLIFDQILEHFDDDFSRALPEFTNARNEDAKAICDLAMYNYIEMRSKVNSRFFTLRKKLDNFLYWLMPQRWIPLYTMVSFTRTRFTECINRRKQQDKILKVSTIGLSLAATLGAIWMALPTLGPLYVAAEHSLRQIVTNVQEYYNGEITIE